MTTTNELEDRIAFGNEMVKFGQDARLALTLTLLEIDKKAGKVARAIGANADREWGFTQSRDAIKSAIAEIAQIIDDYKIDIEIDLDILEGK